MSRGKMQLEPRTVHGPSPGGRDEEAFRGGALFGTLAKTCRLVRRRSSREKARRRSTRGLQQAQAVAVLEERRNDKLLHVRLLILLADVLVPHFRVALDEFAHELLARVQVEVDDLDACIGKRASALQLACVFCEAGETHRDPEECSRRLRTKKSEKSVSNACSRVRASRSARRGRGDAPRNVSFSPMTQRLMPKRTMVPEHIEQGERVLRAGVGVSPASFSTTRTGTASSHAAGSRRRGAREEHETHVYILQGGGESAPVRRVALEAGGRLAHVQSL